jgi:hypothetical protein
MEVKRIMDKGFEGDNEYRNWTYSDEYGEMAIAYYLNALKQEDSKHQNKIY